MGTRIVLCGRLEVELGGQRIDGRLPGRQGPLVLALLALNRNRPVTRDELIGVLWPGRPPADPDEALSALLSKVRHVVGKDTLTGRRELMLALPDGAEIDVEQAHAAVGRAQTATDPAAAFGDAAAAVKITGREFLVGHDAPWVHERRRELDDLRQRALELMAHAGVASGRLPAAEQAARDLVRAVPLREAGHRLLMEALAARGEVAEALAAYERLRVLLRDELGMTPGEAVRAVHERLLQGDPRPAPRRTPLPALLARDRGDLVGREPQLQRLREAWAAARAGQRRLVLLCGGPGIGKTRLAGELARDADVHGTVLYAGCHEDSLVSYQPFVEAFRQLARSASLDAVPALAGLIPELGVAAAPANGPEDPETRRYLMFEAVSTLLSDVGERAPVLLVLDDLHWADRSTLQLLRHVVRAPHDAPLLIVGTYRDLEVSPEHSLWDLMADLRRDGLFERITLEGLDRASVSTLIASHAGQAPPSAVVETVYAGTEGNPFFVGEVVRHLIETGMVLQRDGRWTAALRPEEIGVPEGVKEVLARRLARLSPQTQAVLTQAAALGRTFAFELLCAMAATDEETVIGALEEALGARLVDEQGGADYAFTHALVQETLYGALSAPRRQRLHARAAAAIEAADPGDEDALAVHYRLAGDLVKGVEYSLRAGEHARQLFAWTEAAAHWDGAVTLMERAGAEPAQRARLLIALADLSAVARDPAQQLDYLERALRLYTEIGDDVRAAQANSRLGMAYSLMDTVYGDNLDIGRAFEHFDAARAVLAGGRALGHLETGVATALTYALRMTPGLEAGARAMEIAEQLGDETLWAGAAEAYGWHCIAAGRLSEGFGVIGRAFTAADRGKHPFLASMATTQLGQLTWSLYDPDAAQPHLERLLALPYYGDTADAGQSADGVGRCHFLRGEIEQARALLSDARPIWATHSLKPLLDLWDGDCDAVEAFAHGVLETSRRTGNRWDEFGAQQFAGRSLQLRGETGRAIEALDAARAIAEDGGAHYYSAWVLPDLARALAEAGRLEEARTHVDRCVEILANGEDWRGRGGVAAVAEAVVVSHEGGDPGFAAAVETLRRYRLLVDEADALRQWGLALRRAGDRTGAAEKLEAARAIYAARGAGGAWLR